MIAGSVWILAQLFLVWTEAHSIPVYVTLLLALSIPIQVYSW
jgi:hypothetical protein